VEHAARRGTGTVGDFILMILIKNLKWAISFEKPSFHYSIIPLYLPKTELKSISDFIVALPTE